MEPLHTIHNVPWLPYPNKIELIASTTTAPLHLTKTAFMVPLNPDGKAVLANNRRRGVEIPGGHVEHGETLEQAAIRECFEETGIKVSEVKILGYLKMTSEGEKPEGWKYPHPVSYQQFFAGLVASQETYTENDECCDPEVVDDPSQLNTQMEAIILLAQSLFS